MNISPLRVMVFIFLADYATSCNRYKQQEKAQRDLEKTKKGMEERLVRDVIKEAKEKKMRFKHYHERYLEHCHNVQVCITSSVFICNISDYLPYGVTMVMPNIFLAVLLLGCPCLAMYNVFID